MSGAAGHLRHLHENRQLKFGEIKDVIRWAAEGKLQQVTEKLDGMNLVFTWDVQNDQLRVARNTSDVSNGGMDIAALAKRFFGRQNVEVAFTSAFKVLNDAISVMNDRQKGMTFGNRGQVWYSLEVIYAADPNIINYDSNNIVFHGYPVFLVTDDGVEMMDDPPGLELLVKNIEKMQAAVTLKNWQVRGPALVTMNKLADGSIAKKAIHAIIEAQTAVGVGDNDTLDDYVKLWVKPMVDDLKLQPHVAEMVIERLAGCEGAPTVNDIKRVAPKSMHETIAALIRVGPEHQKAALLPIERAIHQFAIEVLRGMHSALVNEPSDEVVRLRSEVDKAIRAIKAHGNSAALDVLKKEMDRLGSVDNIGSTMEGIVFIYKGQAYKFTGAFAPAHQILALFKYGRKGIPKMSME